MPEGPTIIIAKEAIKHLTGKKVIYASGKPGINHEKLVGKKITDIKTWGKHLLICFKDFTIRIHFAMFGKYRIDKPKHGKPRLHLEFENHTLDFFTPYAKLIEEPLNDIYDWSADIMNKKWSAAKAKQKLKEIPGAYICDALMNQEIFAGVGNIIKNEVLFRTRVHPLSLTGKVPLKQINAITKEVVKYSFEFLEWKQAGTLRKHWEAYAKKKCPRNNIPFHKEYLGKTKRRTFFCNKCQELYK